MNTLINTRKQYSVPHSSHSDSSNAEHLLVPFITTTHSEPDKQGLLRSLTNPEYKFITGSCYLLTMFLWFAKNEQLEEKNINEILMNIRS